jgi:hypothetical protein
VTTQPTAQPRPWAAVAPKLDASDPVQSRAHFAAQFLAHDKALDSLGSVLGDPEARSAETRHTAVGTAAFVAAAFAGPGDHTFTLEQALHALWSGLGPLRAAEWLTAVGIDPASIEAAR